MLTEGTIYNSGPAGKDSFYINNKTLCDENRDDFNIEIMESEYADKGITPRNTNKFINIKSYTNPEFIKSPTVDKRTLTKIDDFIKMRITEEISPFTNELNNILETYKSMHIENTRLSNENDKLQTTEKEIIRLKNDVTFLKSELSSKNDIIKTLLSNKNNPATLTCDESVYGIKDHAKPVFNNQKQTSLLERSNRFQTLAGYNNNEVINEKTANTFKATHLERNNKIYSTCILGDSTIQNVKPKFLKTDIGKNEKVFVKSFSGAIVKQMYHYAIPSLEYEPDRVILHVGTNELRSSKPANSIATEIIDLANSIKTQENDIIISSIVSRGDHLNDKAGETNNILKSLCYEKNFDFIDNSNIWPNKHLCKDNLHLNLQGTQTITKIFCKCINNA